MISSSIELESIGKFIIQFQRRCMSDPTLSDIDFRNKMAWVRTTLNLKNIFGYWMVINIIKGFLNFLVTYEKDLFTELAYEKVIDLWPVFSLFFLRCIQVHSFRFTWFYAFHSKRILIRAKRIYVQFPVEYCILQLICLTRGWCDTMRSLHCQTIMLLLS